MNNSVHHQNSIDSAKIRKIFSDTQKVPGVYIKSPETAAPKVTRTITRAEAYKLVQKLPRS